MGGARRRERVDRGIKVRSDSLYVLSSPSEISYLAAPRALLVVGLLILPLLCTEYWRDVLRDAYVWVLLALAFDFLTNYAGLLCLGAGFLHGVGGYCAALMSTRLGCPIYVSIPFATVLGAAICTAAIYPCLRLRGIYFAVVTLMYAPLTERLITALDIFGTTEGVAEFRTLPSLSPGWRWVAHYVLIVVSLAVLFGLRRFGSDTQGQVIRAIKDNDQAVRAAGISVTWWRTKALFIAALIGCFAGAINAYLQQNVGTSAFAMKYSIWPIAATVIGGAGTLVGPLLGSLFLVPLGELLRDLGILETGVFALILTIFIVFRSEGLIPFAARKYYQFERWVDV